MNNCRYYRYTLNNLNTTELAGHNITCGWRLRGGSYSVSDPPVTILVEPGELTLCKCIYFINQYLALDKFLLASYITVVGIQPFCTYVIVHM